MAIYYRLAGRTLSSAAERFQLSRELGHHQLVEADALPFRFPFEGRMQGAGKPDANRPLFLGVAPSTSLWVSIAWLTSSRIVWYCSVLRNASRSAGVG